MKKIHKSAFSLIELSVVLVVAAIVLAGVLSASAVSIRNAKIKVTNDRIAAIYKALGSFAITNYRLPCPAAMNIARDGAGYGVSVGAAGACSDAGIYQANQQNDILYGMLPVASLGLPADLGEDGFGNKMIYIVNKNFTATDYPSTTLSGFFSSYTETDINITIGALQVASENIINGNAFAIISLGSNGYGAFAANSTTQNVSTSTDTYEAQNYLANINGATTPKTADFGVVTGFVTDVNIIYNNLSSEVFDDIVFFKSRSQMVSDFNMMFLMPCAGDADYTTAYYGQVSYRGTNCTTPAAVTPSKRCGPFGLWIEEQSCFL